MILSRLLKYISSVLFITICFNANSSVKLDSLKAIIDSMSIKQTTENLELILSDIPYKDKIAQEKVIRYAIRKAKRTNNSISIGRSQIYLFNIIEDPKIKMDSLLLIMQTLKNEDDVFGVAKINYYLGNHLAGKYKIKESLKKYQISLDAFKQLGNKQMISYIYMGIGRAYYRERDYKNVVKYLKKSIKDYSQSDDSLNMLYRYHNLLFFVNKDKSYDIGDQFMDTALFHYERSTYYRKKLNIKKESISSIYAYCKILFKLREFKKVERILTYERSIISDRIKLGESGDVGFISLKNHDDEDDIYWYTILSRQLGKVMDRQNRGDIAYDYMVDAYAGMRAEKHWLERKDAQLESSKELAENIQKQINDGIEKKRQRWIIAIISSLVVFSTIILFIYRSSNRKLSGKNRIINKHRNDIIDSINYAKKIQDANLPTLGTLNSLFNELLLIDRPKDIVGGDFYWSTKIGDDVFIAVADCTGHGVPGAFLSLMGTRFLDDIVNTRKIYSPSEILSNMNTDMIKVFIKDKTSKKRQWIEGIDIGVCKINKNINTIQFSGALRNLFIVKEGNLKIIEGDIQSVGGIITSNRLNKSFKLHTFALDKSTFFMGSDGLWDQFDANGKKLNSKRFGRFLIERWDQTLKDQEIHINSRLDKWKGDTRQTDDMLLLGFRA